MLGLQIKADKTKLMKVSRNDRAAGKRIDCGGMEVEAVDKFKYLGSV